MLAILILVMSLLLDLQLILKQHRFELHESTYAQIFFNKYVSTINVFSPPYDFPNNISFSLAYFIVRIHI